MKKMILVLVSSLFVFGCGGGGGGGNGGGEPQFSGKTTQAIVTSSNAKAVSVNAMQGVQSVSVLGALAKKTETQDAPVIQLIADMVQKDVFNAVSKSTAKSVAQTSTSTGSEPGYSGSFSYSINVNTSNGAASGSISFNAYQADSTSPKVAGGVSFNATVNTATLTISSMSMTLSNVTAISSLQSVSLNGSIAITISGTTTTTSLSVLEVDNTNNTTYWLQNFIMTLSGSTMTVSGTYYDYTYGYVVISTITPLTVNSAYSEPTAGRLLFTGSGGTKARMTYSPTGYVVEVDANGNNSFVTVP
jgi:hypothetical protein